MIDGVVFSSLENNKRQWTRCRGERLIKKYIYIRDNGSGPLSIFHCDLESSPRAISHSADNLLLISDGCPSPSTNHCRLCTYNIIVLGLLLVASRPVGLWKRASLGEATNWIYNNSIDVLLVVFTTGTDKRLRVSFRLHKRICNTSETDVASPVINDWK